MPMHYLQWLLLAQLLQAMAAAAKVPAVIVFGDSSVDSGNNDYIATIAKSNFEPYGRDFNDGAPTGRFSNGRLATDFISESFGLPRTVPPYLAPTYGIKDFASGVCFASAGTGYDNATSDVLSVIPLWQELEYFKEYIARLKSFQGEAKAQETLREALYIISMGTNDFLENYFSANPRGGRSSEFTVEEYESFLIGIAEGFIKDIYQLGARKIDVTGIPPMGCLPLERATNLVSVGGCNEEYNKVAAGFNSKLRDLMANLKRDLPDIRIVYGNVYDIFVDVAKKPSLYGFEDVVSGCCASGLFEIGYMCDGRNPLTCTNANKFVFWDAIHPTERMNLVIADRIMKTTLSIFL